MAPDKLFKVNPEPIEAHQVALVAAAFAFDLDWEGHRPTLKRPARWPQFSKQLQDEQRTAKSCECLDREQIYFQAFVFEHCLDRVRTADAGIARVLFEAWDYYLRNLPSSHGVIFDYNAWSRRRTQYAQAWDKASERRAENPDMTKNPFFPIAMCLMEDVCGLGPDALTVTYITLMASQKTNSFFEVIQNLIVNRE